MLVRTHHLTFTLEQDTDETHELHRARAFAIAALLDEHPQHVAHLDAVVAESKRFVALREARCHPMPADFDYFVTRPAVKAMAAAPIRKEYGLQPRGGKGKGGGRGRTGPSHRSSPSVAAESAHV